jgi:nitrite reductase/ring-hydroxylating ferredoxin subunit
MQLAPLAVYRRTIAASLARIWENVLDWEHLPWLHRTTFRYVKLLEQHRDGYRVESALRAPGARPFVIEVALDRPNRLYHNRTIEGAGTGTDIVTRLDPIGPHETGIHVEFLAPGIRAARAPAIGAMYTQLYTQLWDEDERMMVRRQQVLDAGARRGTNAPSAVPLGPMETLWTRLPLMVEADGARVRVVHVDGTLVAHATTCPHLGGPLDDGAIEDGCVQCPWHGYRFDLRTGASADGRGLRLAPAARVVTSADGTCGLTWP